MPFGREAGHFRDITALVATKHPSHIPLTYVYREGDYSTRVDILIMSWRPWEDSYFPPPGYPPLRDHLPPQPQNQPQNAPSPQHSSSSSSNDAPSEPTIDLSSWSPRSHPILNAWKPKLANGPSHPKLRSDWPVFTVSAQTSTLNDTQRTYSISVTKNQTPKSRTHWIFSLMRFDGLPTPRPLDINPFSSLRATSAQCRTLGVATKSTLTAMTDGHCPVAIALGRQLLQSCDTSLALLASSPFEPQLIPLHPPAHSNQYEGQQRPTVLSPHLTRSGPTHDLSHESPLFANGPDLKENTVHMQSPSLHSPSNQIDTLNTRRYTTHQSFHSIDQQCSLSPPGFDHSHFDSNSNEQNFSYGSPQQQKTLPSQLSPHPLSNLTTPASLPTKIPKKPAPRKFLKPMATRRSQRVLAKQNSSSTVPKDLPKFTPKKAQLPFDKDSYETPLDNSTVLAILQATGLQINEQVQQMVDQAAQTDTLPPQDSQSRPPTPLHDSTPPRTVPGIDLPL